MISSVTLAAQKLEQFAEAVTRVTFSCLLKCTDNRFITQYVGTVMINRTAQRKSPSGPPDADRKRLHHLLYQLPLF
ncbi:hypothetical protein EPYR_02749 [Erwinia pyrifoliae DSM 12163]|nr:hypothetical protein EPYR_02749 [Erwinia pyrifoliae DSM 12163]